jgi:hypothetical protein
MRGGSHVCHHSYCRRYRVAARGANTPVSSTINIAVSSTITVSSTINIGFRVAGGVAGDSSGQARPRRLAR